MILNVIGYGLIFLAVGYGILDFIKRRNWTPKGYAGYQVSGNCETTIILRAGSDFTSCAFDFATKNLKLSKEEAVRQLKSSLADGSGEVFLTNENKEKYVLWKGIGDTVKYKMLNEVPYKEPERK